MREFFSRVDESAALFPSNELFELALDDADPDFPGEFVVREARSRWDEKRQRVVLDYIKRVCLPNLQAARIRYAERRHALRIQGFNYSMLDHAQSGCVR